MNRTEVIELLKIVNAKYPDFFKAKGDLEKRKIVESWQDSLNCESYEVVKSRLDNYIKSNKFAPSISDLLKNKINKGFNNFTSSGDKWHFDEEGYFKKYAKYVNAADEELMKMPYK